MKQKIRKLTFVSVLSNGFVQDIILGDSNYAIIDGTYSQLYGGDDIYKYSIYLVEENKIVNHCAWYHESQLSELKEQDREKAEKMIEEYNLREVNS